MKLLSDSNKNMQKKNETECSYDTKHFFFSIIFGITVKYMHVLMMVARSSHSLLGSSVFVRPGPDV